MTLTLIILSPLVVILFAVHLYRQDKEDDDFADSLDAEALTERHDLNGDAVGYCDYYYTTPLDIIILVNQLGVNETVCKEYNFLK